MTRINVVNPQELSDQWLLAEYRELPRVIKQDISIADAPEKYKLGAGHVKWAKKHAYWTMDRYFRICDEMEHRGFKINNPPMDLYHLWNGKGETYQVTWRDIVINVKRLRAKYRLKPSLYRWTKRDVPEWLKDIERI